MTYIGPTNELLILHDVPLDTTYEHSIYFDNPTAQYAYFSGKAKYSLGDLTYQRVKRGYVRVEKNAESLYNCNYIMFRNRAFGNKWFYAFITGVEYISNNVSQISFTLDIIQTWLFDYSFNSCFIERTHTDTDEIGEHYEPEPVAIGEYVLNNYDRINNTMFSLGVIIGVIEVETGGAPKGCRYEGIYSGAKLYFFPYAQTQLADINNFLANYTATPDNVICMYMCPEDFVPNYDQTTHEISNFMTGYKQVIELTGLTLSDTLDGYSPRNKKLYTYPYNFLHVDNGGNGELSLRYEFFDGGAPTLELAGTILQPVSALLTPRYYKNVSGTWGSGTDPKVYFPESLPLTDYPVCSWNFDSFKEWVATQGVAKSIRFVGNLAKIPLNSAGQFTQSIMQGKSGEMAAIETGINNITQAGSALIDYVTSMASNGYLASVQADICKGSSSNGQMNCSLDRQSYYYGRCSINALNAEMIDDFFDKYGYAVNKIGMPKLNVRDVWTYIKTKNCTILGSVPAGDMRTICNIFDKGITFWMDGDEVGRYDYASRNVAHQG